jgi:hypothetical protein
MISFPIHVRTTLSVSIAVLLSTVGLVSCKPRRLPPHIVPGYRAFAQSSYWNTPLAADAPIDPRSDAIISFLIRDNAPNFVQLNGVDRSGDWANPIYWSGTGTPTYAIENSCDAPQPPEFRHVRIPVDARPDPTSDAAMTVYDLQRGRVYAMWHTRHHAASHTWSACGGTVFYLESNGIDGRLPQSDEPRNFGHRGVPPPVFAVRWDEVQIGRIDHVLKIAVNTTACSHVFPMVGDECGTTDPNAPPEGTRIRIKRSVDLASLGLTPAALVVARALQQYGAVIGDQSSKRVNLKVENTVAEGRGWLWKGLLNEHSLAAIPLADYEVLRLGFEPTKA